VTILDSGFLQIPHWLRCGSNLAVLLFLKERRGVSSGSLAFAYMFLSSIRSYCSALGRTHK